MEEGTALEGTFPIHRFVLVGLIAGSERCLLLLSNLSLLWSAQQRHPTICSDGSCDATVALLQSTKDVATKRVSHILQKLIW